jgi:DGQHR domain-containing protein
MPPLRARDKIEAPEPFVLFPPPFLTRLYTQLRSIRRVGAVAALSRASDKDANMERTSRADLLDPVHESDKDDHSVFGEEKSAGRPDQGFVTEPAMMVTQGKRRFYSLVLPSKLLAATCTVEARAENPIDGFQRLLDKRRARDIAAYIDTGFGTVPSAVILSSQPRASLSFDRASGLLRFKKDPRAFLIIDGQHRVFGFNLAKTSVKVPVVVYNNLSRAEECQLFMDINTKQRPVPAELLLDIRKLSELENEADARLREIFDLFHSRPDSVLLTLLSPAERRKGKITRVTFNAALKSVEGTFEEASAEDVYIALNAYLNACISGLREHQAEASIANPAMFRALVMLFPDVAGRVADRKGGKNMQKHFEEVIAPLFRRLKKSEAQKPAASYAANYALLRKTLSAGFSLRHWLFD